LVGGVQYLKIAYAPEAITSSTYTWSCITVDSTGQGVNNRGVGIDLFLDANDHPHLTHLDQTQGAIRYLTCEDTIASCVTTGANAFTAERISLIGTVSSFSSSTSVKVDTSGKRFVAYYSAADQGLILATKAVTDSAWTFDQIESPPTGAGYISTAGQYGVLLLNASGGPMLFYRSLENWIRYFSREAL
jgi:hypothetical protein